MGRAGSGGSRPGGGSSGGAGRTSGGRRIGGSSGSRAGSNSSRGPSRGPSNPGPRGGGFGGPPGGMHRRGGYGAPPPPPPPPHRNHGGRVHYHGRTGRSGCGFTIGKTISTIVVLVVLAIILFVTLGWGSCLGCTSCVCAGNRVNNDPPTYSTTSQIKRQKISNSEPFNANCVVDELGWVDNVASCGKSLQNFYNKTGIQPYVVFLKYNSSLTDDNAKNAYAEEWYDKNINNETSFLFMYFAEKNTDEDVGYMAYVCGAKTAEFMDNEVIDVFYENVESYWYTDLTTDKMIEKIFNSTAAKCM